MVLTSSIRDVVQTADLIVLVKIALQIVPFLLMIVALMFGVIFLEGIATWLPNTM